MTGIPTVSKPTQTKQKGPIKSYEDLEVFQLAFENSMEIFDLTEKFPKSETYALTSQTRRSSRSVAANIVEGWSKRIYEGVFKRQLIDSIGSCDETILWLRYALRHAYITQEEHNRLQKKYSELGRKLFKLHEKWVSYSSANSAKQ